ncbi:hypothetical protein MNBD_GAMMA03-989 [hydrothermal vent metagenome]|uniref:Uncharacterized protein n=1 Tax=hydrothermal vent metagenome TaxID=652676 RepID=A0A3B0WLG0_9ZZZZ
MTYPIDITIRILLCYFLYRGARKGFLKTLLDPVSLILAGIIGFFYYIKTQNLIISLLISIFGPFAINIIFSLCLNLWKVTTQNGEPMSGFSRLSGAILCLFWRGAHLALILILIGSVPNGPKSFLSFQEALKDSHSYSTLNKWTKNFLPNTTESLTNITTLLKNPEKLKKLESTPEFKKLIEDSKIKELMDDQNILKNIQEKNIGKVLAEPKIQAILKDPELLKKFLSLQKEIMTINDKK